MREEEWLASQEPAVMLAGLRNSGFAFPGGEPSVRKLRLFACACCRAVWEIA